MTDIAIPRGSDAANRIVQKVTGPYRKPQNTGEEFAETAGRFVPAAVMGPGNVVRNAVAYGVIPGIASETAGQVFKGGPVEPYTPESGRRLSRVIRSMGAMPAPRASNSRLRAHFPSH
jgi:hypothetical protein